MDQKKIENKITIQVSIIDEINRGIAKDSSIQKDEWPSYNIKIGTTKPNQLLI